MLHNNTPFRVSVGNNRRRFSLVTHSILSQKSRFVNDFCLIVQIIVFARFKFVNLMNESKKLDIFPIVW